MASDSTDIVRRKLKETTTDLAVLLTVYQWRSDTYIRTSLEHKTTLEVFDRDGTLLAQTSVQAAKAGDVLPGVTAGVDTTHTSVPLALKSILEELLNYPNVVTALQRS
jgi:hypothetical protein